MPVLAAHTEPNFWGAASGNAPPMADVISIVGFGVLAFLGLPRNETGDTAPSRDDRFLVGHSGHLNAQVRHFNHDQDADD